MSGRSRRERSNKSSSAQKALEKLRHHRETGEKPSYEIEEQDNLYDVVDEEDYADIVQSRLEDDWIVDDDGGGYVEDGRELFDDELKESSNEGKSASGSKSVKKNDMGKKKVKQNIQSMFLSAKVKRKEKQSLGDDAVLDDILSNIQSPTVQTSKRPKLSLPSKSKSQHQKRQNTSYQPDTGIDVGFEDLEQNVKTEAKATKRIPVKLSDPKPSVEDCNIPEGIIEDDYNDGIVDNFSDVDCDLDDIQALEATTTPINTSMSIPIKEEPEEIEISVGFQSAMKEEYGSGITDQVKVDSSSLPLVEVNGEKVLQFFWFDAYEDKIKQPGVVFLFGKVYLSDSEKPVSCCVSVKNIERKIHFLPRKFKFENGKETEEPVSFKDVYDEFNDHIACRYKILKYKCKKSKKNYAFEKEDVPAESDYLEVCYPASNVQLPMDLSGDTFSCVFGTNTTSLEHLLIGQKIKGPCWLNLRCPELPNQSISWCKLEAFVSSPDLIDVCQNGPPCPTLSVLSLSIQTIPCQKDRSQEVLAVCGLFHPDISVDKSAPKQHYTGSFCLVSKPSEILLPFDIQEKIKQQKFPIQMCSSERAMLGLLLAKLQSIDPDIILGHDLHGFDLDMLLHRIASNKVPNWSKLGRLKRQIMPKLQSTSKSQASSNFNNTSISCGRLTCDTKISCKELMRIKSYDMNELCHAVLKEQRINILQEDVPAKLKTSKGLIMILERNMMDSLYNLKIMFELNAIPLAYQITGICGNVMGRTLLGGRSERNEMLLLHAFHERNYIYPDKNTNRNTEKNEIDEKNTSSKSKPRKKPTYSGGLVLDPKTGFYDKFILLLDFNSLYPSIIQEFNICFTTIPLNENKTSEADDTDFTVPPVPDKSLPNGILPSEIKQLVERRRQVKTLMKTADKDSDLYTQYDIRQKALKLTANSMYGCLGFTHSRFYARPLAALVTSKGREILMKTKDLAQQLGLDVIYGDTDSIMINTNSTDFNEVAKIGNKVKSEVNKLYKLLEIDIDGIFKSMLLLKKKKYAAVSVTQSEDGSIKEVKELKGLDIVRRDWCTLAKDAGNFVLDHILSCAQRDSIVEKISQYLSNLKDDVINGTVDSEKFEINKALAKAPDDYPDKKSLPHVTVAQRLICQGRHVAVGDTIPYIICKDGSNLPATQRAYHPDEIKKAANLKIDHDYYLAQQLHPVVSRLCDPIEEMPSSFIAECLGLDPSNYKNKKIQNSTDDSLQTLLSDKERFKNVECFHVACLNPQCQQYRQDTQFDGFLDSTTDPTQCQSCKMAYSTAMVTNKLQLFIRKHIGEYYKGWMHCDDPTCAQTTRVSSCQGIDGVLVCDCKRGQLLAKIDHGQLYNQLLYIQQLSGFIKKAPSHTQGQTSAKKNSDENVESSLRSRKVKPCQALCRVIKSQKSIHKIVLVT